MKTSYKLLVLAFLSFWLILGLNACSDDSTGADDEESCNISLPSEFAPVTVDVSYFDSQTEPEADESQFQTYFQVEQTARQANLSFGGSAVFILAPQLITFAKFTGVSPEFENGSCVWTISPPPSQTQGLDLTVTVRGSSIADGVNWEIIYDGDLTDGGSVQDYKILTGFTSTDNSNGEWNYYLPENQSSEVLTYTWSVEAEEDYDLGVTANPNEFGVAAIGYSKGGVQNSLTINTGDGEIEAFWDEDLDSGWIELPGESRQCYTAFRNEACP